MLESSVFLSFGQSVFRGKMANFGSVDRIKTPFAGRKVFFEIYVPSKQIIVKIEIKMLFFRKNET